MTMFDLRGGAPEGYHRVCDAKLIAGHATLDPAWQWLTHLLLFATSEWVRNDDPDCTCTRCALPTAKDESENARMNVLQLEDRVVRYTIATAAEMDTIPPWPRYNETRDTTGRHMTLLETRVADGVVRNEYGTDTGALGRRRALEWLDSNARALWEHRLRLRLEPKATAVDPMRCAMTGDLCGVEISLACECATCSQWRWAFGEGTQAGRGPLMARAALSMMLNDFGHTPLCWRDREAHGVDDCMSEACALARRALGIDHLDKHESNAVREALDAAQNSWAAVGQRKGSDGK